MGQSLIELLITIGLMAVILPALLVGFIATRSGRAQQEQRLKATSLMREGEEAVRVVRETDWATFAALSSPANTAYRLAHDAVTGKTWILTGGTETTSDGLTRTINVNDVYRDFTTDPTNAPIVASTAPNATLDPSTKQVVVTVHWNNPLSTTESAIEYLTRDESLKYNETTQAQFDLGTKASVVTTATNPDGEVLLGAGSGSGNWCAPSLTAIQQDLPKNGAANAIYAIEGTVFAGTGDNASGVSFEKVSVTTTYPPVTTPQSTYDGFKTNGVFGEANYAYLATDTNSKEIDIINLNSVVGGKYQEAGWFDAPVTGAGFGQGNSVYVYGNIGFMTDGSKLYTFDLSSKTGSRPQLGSIDLTGSGVVGKRVFVIQDPTTHNIYAFVATTNTSSQLQIFLVSSDGKTITPAGSKGLTAQGGVDLFVSSDGSRVYLTTGYNATQSNVFVLNTTNKASIPAPLSSTNTGGMTPKGITFIQNRLIVVGAGGTYQYQVYQVNSDIISNCDSTDPSIGKVAVGVDVNGVSSVFQSNGDAYSYIIVKTDPELRIIRGGAGGAGGTYAASGIYTSKIIDLGSLAGTNKDVALNNFYVDNTVPSDTTMQYYIGLHHGPCGSTTFAFPSDFSGPYSLTTGTVQPLPLIPSGTGYVNPGQCLQYKAYLTSSSDQSLTPVLNSITFSFSP